jgi:hypothetical protein
MPKFIDLTNKIFGKWTVIEMAGRDKRGQIFWLCECNCELKTIKTVKGAALTSGRSTNCGCERIKRLLENNKKRKKTNRYEKLNETTMIGYASNTNDIFYFNVEDYEKIKDYCWWLNNHGYMYTTAPNSNRRTNMYLHRYIMNFPDLYIDHINRNRLDNRRENLRIVEKEDNLRNISKSFDNQSGYIGVDWVKRESVWRARIVYKGIAYHLGIFKEIKDAIIARLKAELEYFGIDFAPQRHLFAEYGII